MARTFAVIQQEIGKLQQEAEKAKAKEMAGVIERIKEAIVVYSLKPGDLFVTKGRPPGRPKKATAQKVEKAPKKSVSVIKFQDEASGKKWSGKGKRPNWYVQAIAAGKTPEDLAVKPLG
jgi:DNA-binding protein H-NS